ncbi:MAG TPA: MmcQ/YjbR family DNA-binding protein [Candidatus Cybelea sp.]|nr:MmcQ/YjbR family DNA-binding protein [Candidatus Cybelea sp.]
MAVTRQEFRRLALSLPNVEAKSHMHHPDFRVGGKIFATMGYPDLSWGMVKLTPIEQQIFVKADPDAFHPCSGKWGERGATNVKLEAVGRVALRRALTAAWELASALAPARPGRARLSRQ